MATPKNPIPFKSEPEKPDPAKNAAAWKRLQARLRALPAQQLRRVNINVEAVALAVLGVAQRVTEKKLHLRFKSLPAEEFDIAHVNDLADVARAALHAAREAEKLSALATEVTVPLELASEADEVEARMQACAEYHLGDDPEIVPLLDLYRPGTGHRDKANDLLGYADIYDRRASVVEKDTKNYRPGDRDRAIEIAEQIQRHIADSLSPAQRQAMDDLIRARTLLEQEYDEVREAGRWLERKNPKRDERYPNFYAAGRTRQGGRPKKSKTSPAVAAKPA